jgi:hypothetical protein
VGGPPAWGLGGGLTTLPRKTQYLLRITTHSPVTGRITWHNLKKVNKVLLGKPEGKRPLGRPRRRWEGGIRMDLTEIGLGVWIGFDWLRTGTSGGLL